MSQSNIDATTVATVWHSMQTICKEMRHLVKRTAQNYLIGQLQDLSVGIWGADGTTIALSTVSSSVTSFNDVVPNTCPDTYWYRIKSFNAVGESQYSNAGKGCK